MLTLTQKTLDSIKKMLLRQEKEVTEELKNMEKADPATVTALAESSEPGTDSWIAEGHSRAVALGTQLQSVGISIRKALDKLRRGTYGKCEKCKKQIEMGRLLAMPTAAICLSCTKRATK